MNRIRRTIIFFLVTLIILSDPILGLTSDKDKEVYIFILNRWALEDINEMKWLGSEINNMSLGLMNTRGYNSYSGSESFLTISSGAKSVSNDDSSEFIIHGKDKIRNKEIGKIYNLNSKNRYNPEIGYLGERLKENKRTIRLIGNSNTDEEAFNYSALIAMDSKGIVNNYKYENLNTYNPSYPYNIKTNYGQLSKYTLESNNDLTIVDLGDLERLYRYESNYDNEDYLKVRKYILDDIDTYLESTIKEIFKKNDDSLVFLLSPNAPDFNVSDSKLAPLVIINRDLAKKGMTSSTTKRKNIVSNLDIGATILEYFNVEHEGNSIIFREEIDFDYNHILNQNQRINLTSKVRYKTLFYYSVFSIIVIGIVILLSLGKIILPKRIEFFIISLVSTIYTMPIIFIFIPQLKLTSKVLYWVIILLAYIVLIMLEYKKQVLSRNNFKIALITLIYLFIDMLLNGFLTQTSVLSYDPSIGARYYGIGNEMVGVLIGILGIIAYMNIENERSRYLNYIIFVVSIILTAVPKFGANLGGTLALISILIFYFIENMDIRISVVRLLFIGLLIMSSFLVIGILDMKFNPNITHLGRAIIKISNEGLSSFINIAFRKVLMNIKLTGNSFWIYVLLLNLIYLSITNDISSCELKGEYKLVISIIIGIITGFLLNDSGLITAAISLNILTSQIILKQRYKIIEKI